MNVLLVRPDKAGDAIKTLPALRLALRKLPEFKFSLLCSRENASVFAFEKNVRVFLLPSDWQKMEAKHLEAWVKSLPFSKPIDLTVNLLADPFPEVETLVRMVPSKKHWLNSQNPGKTEEHNIAHILGRALEIDLETGLEEMPRAPHLSELDREEAFEKLGPKTKKRIAFCPFAGTKQRSHSDKRWKRFIQYASGHSTDTEIILLGARGDAPRLKMLKADNPTITILTPSSFRTLGAFLEQVDAVVAVDSGPLHLAQSLGKPTLGILSGGDYRRWFPRLTPKDKLLPRGFLSRHPGLFQMCLAFRRWNYA